MSKDHDFQSVHELLVVDPNEEVDNPLDLLAAVARRPKIHDSVMNTKMPSAVKALIEKEADRREVSPAAIVREAVGEYLARRGY